MKNPISCEPFSVIRGNAIHVLSQLQATVGYVVTSPRYYNQRIYGTSTSEPGREPSAAEYISNLANVFKAIPLNPWGRLWVNIGDKRGKHGGRPLSTQRTRSKSKRKSADYLQREKYHGRFEQVFHGSIASIRSHGLAFRCIYLGAAGMNDRGLSRRGWGFRSVLRKNRYSYPDLESGIASELRRLVPGGNETNRIDSRSF
jgi:hypothetical protein